MPEMLCMPNVRSRQLLGLHVCLLSADPEGTRMMKEYTLPVRGHLSTPALTTNPF